MKFDGAPPPPQERYWRGPVLHDFDGYTWKRRPGGALPAASRWNTSATPTATGSRWSPANRAGGSHSTQWITRPLRNIFFTYDYELVARDPVTDTTSYNAVSHTSTRSTQPLSKLARQIETQWPEGRNPRSLQLARDMRARVGSDGAFVDAVLKFFRTGGFVYSLTPPLLDYNSVDDFLFNTRSGFCGHYASAFVTLMRGAGVPARVVTGYLGGEWNPIGELLHRAAVGCALLGGGLARGTRLDPRRSDRRGGAGPADARHAGSAARRGIGGEPAWSGSRRASPRCCNDGTPSTRGGPITC